MVDVAFRFALLRTHISELQYGFAAVHESANGTQEPRRFHPRKSVY
jgi:hypothetical protein